MCAPGFVAKRRRQFDVHRHHVEEGQNSRERIGVYARRLQIDAHPRRAQSLRQLGNEHRLLEGLPSRDADCAHRALRGRERDGLGNYHAGR